MKLFKSILSLSLVFLLIFTLASCKDTSQDPADTSGTTTTPPPTIEELDLSNATIIYPQGASDSVFSAANKLKKDILDKYGLKIDMKKDSMVKESPDACEILIGRTNRTETEALSKDLGKDEYRMEVVNKKLVIAGGSEYATKVAVDKFCESFAEDTSSSEKFAVSPDKVKLLSGSVIYGDLIIATDQRNSCVQVFDLSSKSISSSSAIWSFQYEKYNIADTRVREYNGQEVVLAAYGSNYAKIVTFDDEKKVIWSTDSTADNPHACELLPNGVVAVASSNGNQICFFDINGISSISVDLADAHGLLYDPQLNVLWAIGRTVLTAYDVTLKDGRITVSERTDLKNTIPTDHAHDLQPVYGNPDQMWITTVTTAYVYSKSERKFISEFDGASTIATDNIKSISNFENGTVITLRPDGQFKSWTTKTISIFTKKNGVFELSTLTSGDCDFYKARSVNKNYQ